jgi:Protein of unknown function, DUF488
MRLFTSFWSNPELRDLDAVIVSISRGEPRWSLPFTYRRVRELAPDNETWTHLNRESFERSYIAQLEEVGAAAILERLERINGTRRPVVMLCWERPDAEYCHRWTLSRFIERDAGIVVPELQPRMLPRRATAQPPLFNERGGA